MNTVRHRLFITFEDFIQESSHLDSLQFMLANRFRPTIPSDIVKRIQVSDCSNPEKIQFIRAAFDHLSQQQTTAIAFRVLGIGKVVELCKIRRKNQFNPNLLKKIQTLKKKISRTTKFAGSINLNPLQVFRIELISKIQNPNNLADLNQSKYFLKAITRGKSICESYSKKEIIEMALSFSSELFDYLDCYFSTGKQSFLIEAIKQLDKISDLLNQAGCIQNEKMKEIREILEIIRECSEHPHILMPLLLIPQKKKELHFFINAVDRKGIQLFLEVHRMQMFFLKKVMENIQSHSAFSDQYMPFFLNLETILKNIRIKFDLVNSEFKKIDSKTSSFLDLHALKFQQIQAFLLDLPKLIIEFEEQYIQIVDELNKLKKNDSQNVELKKMFNESLRLNSDSLKTVLSSIFLDFFEYFKNLNVISNATEELFTAEERMIRSECLSATDILMNKFFYRFDVLYATLSNLDLGDYEHLKACAYDYLNTIRKEAGEVQLAIFEYVKEKNPSMAEIDSRELISFGEKIDTVLDDLEKFALITPKTASTAQEILSDCIKIMHVFLALAKNSNGMFLASAPWLGTICEESRSQEMQQISSILQKIVSTLSDTTGSAFKLEILKAEAELAMAHTVSSSYRLDCIKWIKKYLSYIENLKPDLKQIENSPHVIKNVRAFIRIWKKHLEIFDTLPDEPEEIMHEELSGEIANWRMFQSDLQANLINFFSVSSHPLLKLSMLVDLSKGKKKRRRRLNKIHNPIALNIFKKSNKSMQSEPTEKNPIEASILKKFQIEKENESSTSPNAESLACRKKLISIENFCRRIPELLFTTINPTQQQTDLHRFREEALSNLLQAILQLNEIYTADKNFASPAHVLVGHLMVAIALEQSLKMILASREIYLPGTNNHVLVGVENSCRRLIDQHQVSRLLKFLNGNEEGGEAVVKMNKEDLDYVECLDLFIPLTSRYETFGGSIMKKIEEARTLKKNLMEEGAGIGEIDNALLPFQHWSKESMDHGLNIIALILNTLDSEFKTSQAPLQRAPYVAEGNGLPKICTTSHLQIDLKEKVQAIEEELDAIDEIREDYSQRKVLIITGEKHEDVLARKRQVNSALCKLKKTIASLYDVMLDPLDPATCVSITKFLFLKCAVAVEQASQLLLSHLPIPNPANPCQHVLFKAFERGQFKHSHRIKEFLYTLIVYARRINHEKLEGSTRNLIPFSEGMEEVIKQLYRYHANGEAPMQKLFVHLEKLSSARIYLNDPFCTLEDREQIISNIGLKSDDPLGELDKDISTFLQSEVIGLAGGVLEQLRALLSQYRAVIEE